jgi:3-oxoacyl-[acyl-carrier protein] reductase
VIEPWSKGKVAVITGGGSGIGRGIAHRLAAAGVALVLADLIEERAQNVASEAGGQAVGLRIDVSKPADAARLVQTALDRFGRLDFLINSAGNAHVGPVLEMPFEAWRSVLDVHLTGTFLCCQAAIDPIVASRGRIVSLSSNYGFKGRPNGAHYSAAKAGIVALTKVLAAELAPHVNVNAIAPGPIDTPRWRAGLSDAEYAAKRARRIQDIPLERMGEPDDIADAALFLLSPASRWVTGQVLHVNGGEFML